VLRTGRQVWSLVALPDSSGFLSASADHDVKFWEWELRTDAAAGSAQQCVLTHAPAHCMHA
jgi:U3 small nucleolar RNA-associated protein 12